MPATATFALSVCIQERELVSCEVSGVHVVRGTTHVDQHPSFLVSSRREWTIVLLGGDEPQEQHDELQVIPECLGRGLSDKHCLTVHRPVSVFHKTSRGDGRDRVSHQRRTVGGCASV